jgi:hypothetical protein
MYIPEGIGEIIDHLSLMMLSSPTFLDKTGYFPDRNIKTVFLQLNEGLRLIRVKLGEERYLRLMQMSDQMRAHFEADPEDKTDDSLKGRDIILEMKDLLKQSRRKS